MTITPRLTLACVREGESPTPFAYGLVRACARDGVSVAVLVIGPDRDLPGADEVRGLVESTGHAVHRIDPTLMAAPSIQRVVARVAAGVDLALIIAFAAAIEGDDAGGRAQTSPALLDVLHAVGGPLVLCADDTPDAGRAHGLVRTLREIAAFVGQRGPEGAAPPIALLLEPRRSDLETGYAGIREEGVVSLVRRHVGLEAHAVHGRSYAATGDSSHGGNRDATSGRWHGPELHPRVLAALVDHARSSPPLPPPIVHTRRRLRARIGLVLDECFDLYDEESLVQFEMAGAELVPVAAISNGLGVPRRLRHSERIGALDGLDGLVIGDGHIERYSASLAASRGFRNEVRALVGRGAPTIGCGGGYAYLTRGLRTAGGALHPMAGVIDAEAVVVGGPLPRGHVEVEMQRETVIGAAQERVRGYVQRTWLVRGARRPAQVIYTSVSGPSDVGYGSANLATFHFRPYWPSCAGGVSAFVDRCVSFAAAREFGTRGRGAVAR